MDSCFVQNSCIKYKNYNCDLSTGFCQRLFRLNYLYDQAFITDKQRQHKELYLDDTKVDKDSFLKLKKIQDNIYENVQNGLNIYICSPITGNGKTEWSLRLIQEYFNSIWYKTDFKCRGLFINVPRFLLSLKDNISTKTEYIEHIKQNVLNTDIIIWDDLGTKGTTEFETENLLSMINCRLDEGKCNIYTSNILPNELQDVVGQRLASRIIGMSEIFIFAGKDKRGINI